MLCREIETISCLPLHKIYTTKSVIGWFHWKVSRYYALPCSPYLLPLPHHCLAVFFHFNEKDCFPVLVREAVYFLMLQGLGVLMNILSEVSWWNPCWNSLSKEEAFSSLGKRLRRFWCICWNFTSIDKILINYSNRISAKKKINFSKLFWL